ncbi:hypothetical protein PQX77_018028 [Marasmius sp. AFHP31]|nr:hypothetical protein PQX77_018028 [Marasmius sp. AFHP31]
MIGPWRAFSRTQLKNITTYIVGIMFYKFALEWYNGAFITLANERFGENRYYNIGILTGVNYAMQCIGTIIVAPLIKKYPTRSVLSTAVLVFGVISATLLVVDASTGGVMKYKTGGQTANYGTVELIRRVIPRDIVGGDVQLLRRTNAMVHILYEVAGTIGAFTSVFLIDRFGYNYSFFLSPVLFTLAAATWMFVDEGRATDYPQLLEEELDKQTSTAGYLSSVATGFRSFSKATYYGAFLVFSHRRFSWFVSGYALAVYSHRYLENGLAPVFAKQVLGTSAWSQIIVGGSNLGELFGAMAVLLTTNHICTPLPWLRLDAIALNIVWVLPFINVVRGEVAYAWVAGAIFLPISFGWAAGDVSLSAYIQSTLSKIESRDADVSALGSVMAFLYVLYIVIYAVLSTVLGQWVDNRIGDATGEAAATIAREALKYIGGVHFSVLGAVLMLSSFIPKRSFAFNPRDDDFNGDEGHDLELILSSMPELFVVAIEMSHEVGLADTIIAGSLSNASDMMMLLVSYAESNNTLSLSLKGEIWAELGRVLNQARWNIPHFLVTQMICFIGKPRIDSLGLRSPLLFMNALAKSTPGSLPFCF